MPRGIGVALGRDMVTWRAGVVEGGRFSGSEHQNEPREGDVEGG